MHHYVITRPKSSFFRPSLSAAFARNVYVLLGLGIVWSVSLLVGIALQTHGQSYAGIGHSDVYVFSTAVFILMALQGLITFQAYSRMIDGHAELDESDTIHNYEEFPNIKHG